MQRPQAGVDVSHSVARSVATLKRSLERISSSERCIRTSAVRPVSVIRGGSTTDDGSEVRRARVRLFLSKVPNDGVTIWAGRSVDGKNCDVCHQRINVGATEYEIVLGAVSFRLDRACFAEWENESKSS